MSLIEQDRDIALCEGEAARILSVSVRTLQSWRVSGRGPSFVKLGGRAVRYRRADLAAFVEQNIFNSTTEFDRRRA
jgi:excisionase family DNA binding protein